MVQAAAHIIQDVKENKISIDQLDEKTLENYLYTRTLPDPDIVIRTGGEKRISNFLMWQSSMSELCFVDELFPDFKKPLFIKALKGVYHRKQALNI
ncbi:undecaprenyl diphosphate synthase [Gracilibacillus boraciitolerans JCM 21714]|uniref:Undecaprenyl diphosphate synthase n=1 Tax=Gracilibacillus boraciitolerans JCM 21714 TaxID=1298598 RepID=W4VN36_9BACI|nr:undecaprenyl diphosphate synthase [Gracilibacillus boraciitolerans JCM 21714]